MSLAAWILRLPVHAYRLFISPMIPGCCRFQPTCSSYAIEALQRHGALAGGWLMLKRLLRCHPWGGAGFDPVPEHPWRRSTDLQSHPCVGQSALPCPSDDLDGKRCGAGTY